MSWRSGFSFPWTALSYGFSDGYAYAGAYRSRPAYRNTLENSVYIREEARGRAIGRRLLEVPSESAPR